MYNIGDTVYHEGRKGTVVGFYSDGKVSVYFDGESHPVAISKKELGSEKPVTPSYTKQVSTNPYAKPLIEETRSHVVVDETPIAKGESRRQKNSGGNGMLNIKKFFGGFGKTSDAALTFDGKVVIRRANGDYVRYDEVKEQIVNNLSLVFEGARGFFYILPSLTVAPGDIISFKSDYFQVLKVLDNGSVVGINLDKGTKSTICKETNVLGLNFYNKITSLIGTDGNAATGINPMMFLLMKEKGDSAESLLPLLMLSGQGTDITKNPMMLMALMGDGGFGDDSMKDILMLQMLTGAQTPAADGTTHANPLDFASNPMMAMMLLGDGGLGGDGGIKDLLMLQMLGGTAGATAGGFNPMMLMLLGK